MKQGVTLLLLILSFGLSAQVNPEQSRSTSTSNNITSLDSHESYGYDYEILDYSFAGQDSSILDQIDINHLVSVYRKQSTDTHVGSLDLEIEILIYSEEKSNFLRKEKH